MKKNIFRWSKIKHDSCNIEKDIPSLGTVFGEIFYDEVDKFCLETDVMNNESVEDLFVCSLYNMKSIEEAKEEFEKLVIKSLKKEKEKIDKFLAKIHN